MREPFQARETIGHPGDVGDRSTQGIGASGVDVVGGVAECRSPRLAGDRMGAIGVVLDECSQQ